MCVYVCVCIRIVLSRTYIINYMYIFILVLYLFYNPDGVEPPLPADTICKWKISYELISGEKIP